MNNMLLKKQVFWLLFFCTSFPFFIIGNKLPSNYFFTNLSFPNIQFLLSDTIPTQPKYKGYRLHLTAVQILKETNDWTKIKFTVINTGRKDINFKKKGTEHWVQFQFDDTLYESKLGGFKEHIKRGLFTENFSLKAGKMKTNQELQFSTLPLQIVKKQPTPNPSDLPKEVEKERFIFTANTSDSISQAAILRSKKECPDLIIHHVNVIEQSKKSATIEYTLTNIGKGPLDWEIDATENDRGLGIRAYISGVPRLSRGALNVGGTALPKNLILQPNEYYTGTFKLDTRSKTRYMKHVILSLDTYQLLYECDRTNNTNTVELK